jgi:hypothetical protein
MPTRDRSDATHNRRRAGQERKLSEMAYTRAVSRRVSIYLTVSTLGGMQRLTQSFGRPEEIQYANIPECTSGPSSTKFKLISTVYWCHVITITIAQLGLRRFEMD